MHDSLNRDVNPISMSLDAITSQTQLKDKLTFAKICENWEVIFPEEMIKNNLKPFSFSKGKLKLKANEPTWKFEFNLHKSQILENVNKFPEFESVVEIEII